MGRIFDPVFMIQSVPEILTALPITLLLAFVSAIIGLVLALVIALIRYFNVKVLTEISKVYVSFIRGTPALVQIMLVYFGIPLILKALNEYWGTNFNVNGVPRLVFAIIALSLNAAAFMSETIRSSLLAVDVGQLEAAYSVNMSVFQALRRIVVPQAFSIAIPPLANTLVSIIKETSLVFTISIIDLMARAKIVGSRGYRFFEIYVVVSVIYWVICTIISRLLSKAEKGARKHERSITA
ncbi:amino acid ABC transporter permease [Leadbettera azotonutricia]|uniref:L-cystine transport system permease protein TcyL n=1 Tax=Leadbettera azotonutricia (strain ATCC BAA-888 / DSM 13862 / ZAS-9) TaxID=545695 RepID=F5YBL3_LEAAZ|nr:amino acid ABC transporter permease [Leadbettera azotonutricia]AEF82227.1 L-cystine transport system permease protein TcyL [Leadbettera azotonutricia ZAS-9]